MPHSTPTAGGGPRRTTSAPPPLITPITHHSHHSSLSSPITHHSSLGFTTKYGANSWVMTGSSFPERSTMNIAGM